MSRLTDTLYQNTFNVSCSRVSRSFGGTKSILLLDIFITANRDVTHDEELFVTCDCLPEYSDTTVSIAIVAQTESTFNKYIDTMSTHLIKDSGMMQFTFYSKSPHFCFIFRPMTSYTMSQCSIVLRR